MVINFNTEDQTMETIQFLLNIGRVVMKQTQMYVCTLEEFISSRC